jgi:hypothetical protein
LSRHKQRLPDYCAKVGLPENGQDFVAQRRQWLSETARKQDYDFPHEREHVTIGQNDEPILRKTAWPTKFRPARSRCRSDSTRGCRPATCWAYSRTSSIGHLEQFVTLRNQ